jgi:hypothetical protein
MNAPQNLNDLVTHLKASPWVTLTMQDLPPARRRFERFEDGRLHWTDEHGRSTFTPLSCKHTGSETGLDFTGDGFIVTKFGVEMVFAYGVPPKLA